METGDRQEMLRCEITGKLFPADEVVIVFGQQVSAEGKAILLSRYQSGERMPGEMDRPNAIRRTICVLIDFLILISPLFVFAIYGVNINLLKWHYTAIVQVALTLGEFFYFAELHAWFGGTVGKLVGGLRVVHLDGTPISRKTAYARALIFPGPSAIIALIFASIAIFLSPITAYSIARTIHPLRYVGLIWFLMDGLVGFFDRNRQRAVHDRVAGTRVIVKN
ncbi:MAG TPA: RDD family protein [Tepidisphaeraceae bacterium]|jgi:uncharacterized RDD family membrane protein YckC